MHARKCEEGLMDLVWTQEAVDAALAEFESCRRNENYSDSTSMFRALRSAAMVQSLTVSGIERPKPIVNDENGLAVGDWVKDANGYWCFAPILYD